MALLNGVTRFQADLSMINHRIASTEICKEMFSQSEHSDFESFLNEFLAQIKDMSDKGQYTIVSHALGEFDKQMIKSKCTGDMIVSICKVLPVSLKACMTVLNGTSDKAAEALAHNIAFHESYAEQGDVYIEEVIPEFGKRGFSTYINIILEGLFKLPSYKEEFDYQGFVETLYDAFDNDYEEVISWAISYEKAFMATGFAECVPIYSKQYMGNQFYKKGLKQLGSLIMSETAQSATGVELFERLKFTGRHVVPFGSSIYKPEALACYLLGVQDIGPEWFQKPVHGLSGTILSLSHRNMVEIKADVKNSNIDKLAAIIIANSSSGKAILEVQKTLKDLGVSLSKEMADYSFNEALKYFVDKPAEIIEIVGLANDFVATLDFTPFASKIEKCVEAWSETWSLGIGAIMACHFKSVNGFPINNQNVATAVDRNWSIWSDKDRRIALDNLPYEVVVLSRQLKGLKISNDLGL